MRASSPIPRLPIPSLRAILAGLALMLAATPAFAHTGVGSTVGFAAGFGHPLGGLDHVLAMVAVGLLAAFKAQHGDRRALWLLPAAFVGVMAIGGAMGLTGVGLVGVEAMILASVFALGALVALDLPLPVGLLALVTGGFALFHGHSHGTEIAEGAGAASYAIGFLLATALLHVVGIALGMVAARRGGAFARPVAGGLVLAGGLMLVLVG